MCGDEVTDHPELALQDTAHACYDSYTPREEPNINLLGATSQGRI